MSSSIPFDGIVCTDTVCLLSCNFKLEPGISLSFCLYVLSKLEKEMPKSEGKSKRALIESDSDDEDNLEEVRLVLKLAELTKLSKCKVN